ncbi:cyclin-dependent kinase-like 2 isoform X3 [Salmo salar]|uniref:Cyclin-dependent kinase-like 2 n=1 Tax=Salmo salar TaxID=8030 RepID=A0ABM3E8F4_SALSA|nr:cyclin-dependent kinase-like 2 isoform X3 [Salmo salar]|eukprot:XP_014012265.1 PREDICTED: cyclin-dependent kinase-like 2 isoform X2 [Salmo salar]
MEKYENLGMVGEGSYGMVMKCRHKENGRIVAVKKFLESEDDKTVKKIALREIKMLKQLRHENLVNLLEVWKKRRRWYLVFEFVERTVLDDLEQSPTGLDYSRLRRYIYQILRAISFCHQHNIIHRDIKPENILVSQGGVVKLCDFGFARTMAAPGENYTDYVATRWYRAPELLVGDTKYGKAVDVWAAGCLFVEMLTGEPLFPGDSDIDQLYHIIRCFGNLTPRHQELFYENPVFSGVRLPEVTETEPLQQRYPKLSTTTTDLTQRCLQMDPDRRSQCSDLLQHQLFTNDGFHLRFVQELNGKIQKDQKENSPLPKMNKTTKKDKEDVEERTGKYKDSSSTTVKGNVTKPDVTKLSKTPTTTESKPRDPDKTMESTTTMTTTAAEKTDWTTETHAVAVHHGRTTTVSLSNTITIKPRAEEPERTVEDHGPTQDQPLPLIPPLSLTFTQTPSHNLLAVVTHGNGNLGGVGVGPHPGTLGLRISQQSLSSHFTGNLMAQMISEKSVIHERSFLSDRERDRGDRERMATVGKRKPDILFPELRTSLLPEIRGAEGKQNKPTRTRRRRDTSPL